MFNHCWTPYSLPTGQDIAALDLRIYTIRSLEGPILCLYAHTLEGPAIHIYTIHA
jgi:hypothetical protein